MSHGEQKSKEYKEDLNSKNDDLKKLEDEIGNNNHGNESLHKKISENEKTIKEISNEIQSLRKSMESFKEKAQKIDKETFQESEKSALNFSGSTEERRKFTEFVIDLTETNPIHDNIQKNWDELWENYNKLIKEKEEEQATLKTEISNWEKQIQINQNKIKEKNMK
ncbi:hypothetical protein [Spiroplasma endosymbiont of Virgichneumon dumeticola]|uniref:hypothetical protein n=1 Tax=Spiroplasma endosymbiont of Virgichneumon dumeticola TaxID=3139323 RepID=UPI0035C8D6B2